MMRPQKRFEASFSAIILKSLDNLQSVSDSSLECIFLKDGICGQKGRLVGFTVSEIIAGSWGQLDSRNFTLFSLAVSEIN